MVIEIRIMVNFRKVVIVKDGFGESYIFNYVIASYRKV